MHEKQKSPAVVDLTKATLPKLGMVAEINGSIVAACFLRMLEGGYAHMDTMVSDPTYSSEYRHIALTAITKLMLSAAKHMGLHGILAWSMDESILKRAEDAGFRLLPSTIAVKKL
jgi:hypothetical protein